MKRVGNLLPEIAGMAFRAERFGLRRLVCALRRSGLVRAAGAGARPPAEHPAHGSKLPPSAKRGQVRALQSAGRET